MHRGLMTKRFVFFILPWVSVFSPISDLFAGEYLDSAHGSSTTGVYRPVVGNTPPAGLGYSRGNCAHCHEMHGSIAGSEPLPSSGGASAHELFAHNFETARTTTPYSESDNFCFYCHNNPTSAQSVLNNDYSQNFGCAPQGTSTIMSTMNQVSYHNLYDVLNFSENQFSWFTNHSNPCNACHNPHLAKRNWVTPQDPANSAISIPTDHFSLWGTTETMGGSYNTRYEPPYCSDTLSNREPAASGDAVAGRENTPDYVAFCTSCHTSTNIIYSTTLSRNLRTIDWSSSGEKHGVLLMDGSVSTKAPYDFPPGGTNFVLSCLDCHEPHGSGNVMLLRRRANGSDLTGPILSLNNGDLGLLCLKCHNDDAAANGGSANSWEYVHHLVADAPYVQITCIDCHSSPLGGDTISCEDCHFHGSVISTTSGNRDGF